MVSLARDIKYSKITIPAGLSGSLQHLGFGLGARTIIADVSDMSLVRGYQCTRDFLSLGSMPRVHGDSQF